MKNWTLDVNRVVQCSPIIMQWLGSIGMKPVISESCYKGTILQHDHECHFPIIPL